VKRTGQIKPVRHVGKNKIAKQRLAVMKKLARQEGLAIRVDPRLTPTPFRAMNPRAARELHQPYIPRTITFQPNLKKNLPMLAMDINHELIEYEKIGQGWHYKAAHKCANRKQRHFSA